MLTQNEQRELAKIDRLQRSGKATSAQLARGITLKLRRRQQQAEPDLGQMFDMAYEDQCCDACGL